MRIIISPAKKMQVDSDTLAVRNLPLFLKETQVLMRCLQRLESQALQKLWQCSESIATLNERRLAQMDLEQNLTPALLAYEGIQYQYMAPGIFEEEQYEYLEQHLRIISGFYGVLRPFDGVVPYRLEMQARLAVGQAKNLYEYWGAQLALQLAGEADVIVNLASKEYSKAILPYLPQGVRVITCQFGELLAGKIVEKGITCKMARGKMVRFLAEYKIREYEEIKQFNELNYCFAEEWSTEQNYVFLKGGK
ncbi:MAG TPA: peroxide stress protein YaaA [Candidatus Avacidaminococcus intestinavium]|uniref:UPF0246 protein IAB06_04995 n=1 Tax=Candidatus Avacidaminococcus intestinavium TaxID=2840684 RepID=A0A9D1SL24_9FIRM|nr:peroxide stress protein YaaA [Candidatus Avacidaminococcus intestinavium]